MFVVLLVAVGSVGSPVSTQSRSGAEQAPNAGRQPVNAEEYDRMFRQISNWGRWGKADELGSANLVTADTRRRAASLVRSGISVSLAHNFITEPAEDAPPASPPIRHIMNPPRFSSDTYTFAYHGQIHSHIDSLCHWSHDGRTYNGYPRDEVNTAQGCLKFGIDRLKDGIVTRGILIDIPRLRGLPYLEPSTPIYPEDIEAWEKHAGVRISSGDAIFLRTGRWARREALGPWRINGVAAGFHASVLPLLRARDVAFVGSDAVTDVEPSHVEGVSHPLHEGVLAALGANLFDNQDLEPLAQTAAKLRRWEFMVTFAPLPVTRGTGGPINVMATF